VCGHSLAMADCAALEQWETAPHVVLACDAGVVAWLLTSHRLDTDEKVLVVRVLSSLVLAAMVRSPSLRGPRTHMTQLT
jgi:hypothetical protein